MVQEVWLHIGSAKSGTSSLQKHMEAHRDALSAQGLAYIAVPKRATINELVFAYNKRKHEELKEIAGNLNSAIANRPERIGMLSSEMLFGFKPEVIYELLPALRDRPLNVLVYLRRQDRYIEAVYLQKSKNFRFLGSIDDYIAHFKGSGSNYAEVLAGWAGTSARIVPRVMERQRLVGGSVVTDALAQMGLPTEGVEEDADNNISPGYHRVQLLQAAAMAGLSNPRKLQRRLAADYPQDPADRTPVLSQARRRAWLDRFAACNEELRQTYFPDQETLFDESDLERPDGTNGIPPFTEAQLREIMRLFATLKKVG
ncbi:MAG: hypothetical protein AAGP08_06010 [Pseudomonadota bacterium]